MAKKLGNLLSFTEHEGIKKFNKRTKRTEIGGDVFENAYAPNRAMKIAYIIDNLDELPDDTIDSVYNMVSNT